MTIKLTKRIAADLMGRGLSSIRIHENGLEGADKAITREDVRTLIKEGKIYALKEKRNISAYSKVLKKKRAQGRKRGSGRRKGTKKARQELEYKKKIRAQRRVLQALRGEKIITNEMFKDFYRLVRGGSFVSKASLLGHITSTGVKISDEKFQQVKHV